MTAERKHRLVDRNPRWVTGRYHGDGLDPNATSVPARGIRFDCPEGHEGCSHAIPFTPALDGSPSATWQQNGAIWQRSGDTFETLTLSPSIRREPTYSSHMEGTTRSSPSSSRSPMTSGTQPRSTATGSTPGSRSRAIA